MIKVMEQVYKSQGMALNVTDLAEACKNLSQAEVTKKFVEAASFMLSTTLGSGKNAKPAKRTGQPLWEAKKLAAGQWLSQTAYYCVQKVDGNTITVLNSHGNQLMVSKDILEQMESADHFKTQVVATMTQLVEVLEAAQDTIFTVVFKKQPKADELANELSTANIADFQNATKLSQFAKSVIEGATCQMTCYLVTLQNILGRSTVIDLNAKTAEKFRQIDHRTIESIILRNVKYVLKKSGVKGEAFTEVAIVKNEPKWDFTNLAVGNWFSTTNYFNVKVVSGDKIQTRCDGKDITVSSDIMEYEMNNSAVYAKEEKESLTHVAELLAGARTQSFTATFRTKVDEKECLDQL